MCVPAAALSSIALGAQIGGTAMMAVGAYQQSEAAKDAYGYQAAVSRNNATLAEWAAQDAITRGQTAESRTRMQTAALKSKQRAILAANGVALDEGSPLNLLQDTDYLGELDALTVRDNAAREAWGARAQGANYTANAGLLQARGDAENPLFSGATSLLTGAGTVADSWYRRQLVTGGVK